MATILVFDLQGCAEEIERALQQQGHDVLSFTRYETFVNVWESLPPVDVIVTRDNLRSRLTDPAFDYGDNLKHVNDLRTNERYGGKFSGTPIIAHSVFQYRLDDRAKIERLIGNFVEKTPNAILAAVGKHVPALSGKQGRRLSYQHGGYEIA